jgi:hypothetical protein
MGFGDIAWAEIVGWKLYCVRGEENAVGELRHPARSFNFNNNNSNNNASVFQ